MVVFLIEWDSHLHSVLGVTTQQTAEPEKEPVFSVSRAVDTGYLRTAVGEFYSYGRWTDTGPIELSYSAGTDVRTLVAGELDRISSSGEGPSPSSTSALLSHSWTTPALGNRKQEITVSPHSSDAALPAGNLPV